MFSVYLKKQKADFSFFFRIRKSARFFQSVSFTKIVKYEFTEYLITFPEFRSTS